MAAPKNARRRGHRRRARKTLQCIDYVRVLASFRAKVKTSPRRRASSSGGDHDLSFLSADSALSAVEAIRLDTWAVAIASEIRDREPVADGDSFRLGTHGSLKLNPGGSWYDFEDGKGGRDT